MNGEVHPTFRKACRALNLLDDESHINGCLETAATEYSTNQGRKLFATDTVVTHCLPGDPQGLFQRFEEFFSEGHWGSLSRRWYINLLLAAAEGINILLEEERSANLNPLQFDIITRSQKYVFDTISNKLLEGNHQGVFYRCTCWEMPRAGRFRHLNMW